MDTAIPDRIDAIAATYRQDLHRLVTRHWSSRTAALVAVSLYYETQLLDLTYAALWQASRALLHAYRAIFAAFEPAVPAEWLEASATDLRHARELLDLAGGFCLFADYQELTRQSLLDAHVEADTLTFTDPSGVLAGPVVQARDEEQAGRYAGQAAFGLIETRLPEQEQIAKRERRDVMERGQLLLLDFYSALPKQSRRDPIRSYLFPDALARIYASQEAYRAWIVALTAFLAQIDKAVLPAIGDDEKLGSITWGQLVKVCTCLAALSSHHHRIPRKLALPEAVHAKRGLHVFVPDLSGPQGRRLPTPMIADLLIDTTRGGLERLLSELLDLPKAAVATILDACILRDLPRDKAGLANYAFSGLVETGPGRLLLVPTLGRYLSDSDTIQRLARTIDPLHANTVLSAGLGNAPEQFIDALRADPELVVVRDRILRQQNGNRLSDIDLGIYDRRSNVLVLLEFKSLWLQDVDTIQSIHQTIESAASQLKRIADHLATMTPADIGRLFETPMASAPRCVPIIITRRFAASRSRAGYPVLPHATLRRLLVACGNRMEEFAQAAEAFDPADVIGKTGRFKPFAVAGLRWKAPLATIRNT